MKKLILLLCAAVLAFSLTACVSSETPAQTPSPTPTPTPELSAYDKTKNAILDNVDYAYSGLTAANEPIYFLLNNGGSFAALFIENTYLGEYIKFVGSATADRNGIITITDSEKGYYFGFTAKMQQDGSYFLNCGNLGEGYLKDAEPEKVVDSIMTASHDMKNATDELIAAISQLDILDYVDSAYIGVMEDGSLMYYLESDDGSFAALVIESPEETQYVKFIGSVTTDLDSGIITVTDRDKGYMFGFSVEPYNDGSFLLDCGNLGEAYLEPYAPESILGYITVAFEEMQDVTDELMAELGR